MYKKRRFEVLINSFCQIFYAVFWIFLIFGFEEKTLAITTCLCALIHEMGHALCIVFTRATNLNLKSTFNGLRFKHQGIGSYDEELLIYLCGPLANILTFFICAIFSLLFHQNYMTIGIINLATAISNLIPIKGNDGYGAILTIIKKRELHVTYFRFLSCISSALIFIFCILSLYLIDRHGGGYWIFFVFFVSMLREINDSLKEKF